MQKRFSTLMIILLTALSASLSAAPVGYSVNSDSPSDDFSDGLYTIDLVTGIEIERIGTVQSALLQRRIDVEGLAFAFTPEGEKILYGVDDESLKVFVISLENALVDPDQDYDISELNNGNNDFGMTFACDENLYITSVADQSLYRLGPEGEAVLVGGSEKGKLGQNISSLAAFGFPVQLYGLSNGTVGDNATSTPTLYRIDTITGVATEINALSGDFGPYAESGLAFDDAGNLWAMTDRRPVGLASQVMQIDTTSGAVSNRKDVQTTTSEESEGFESLAITGPGGCTTSGNGQTATFFVQKRFTDGNNNTPVTLNFQCNGGTVFNGTKTLFPTEDDFGIYEVSFTVDNIPSAPISCEVWEDAPPGYTPEYSCQSETSCSTSEGVGPCTFEGIAAGQQDLCLIVNEPTPVEVEVTKVWEVMGNIQADIDTDVLIRIQCDAEIVDGEKIDSSTWMISEWLRNSAGDYNDKDGVYTGIGSVTAEVIPTWYPTAADPDDQEYTVCWATENIQFSAVEVDNGCGDTRSTATMQVPIGMGDSCTITNTVFFEGIPSLNQYGLILITALMLLTGMFAMRRIV